MMRMFYTSTTRIASTTLFAGKVLGMVVLLSSFSVFADAQDRGATSFGTGRPNGPTVHTEEGGRRR
jgi:hypothetical protein